jgi:alcohol dehydrogenase (cytochrome c)
MRVRFPVLTSGLLLAFGATTALQTEAQTRPAATTSIDWPSFNNDVGSNRYGAPALITKTNVGSLHVVCSASFGSVTDFQSGPIAVSGVLYATSLTATYAVNGTTCAKLWTKTYTLPAGSYGGTNRGAAYANGLIYRGFADGHVVALSARTGATVWNVAAIAKGSHAYFNAAPIVSGGRLFIGTAGGDIGEAGHVMALDAATGAAIWSAQTVPNLGTTAAGSWKGATHIAGGTTWTSYTLDTASNLLYVPAGNPGADFYGADRSGVNLGSDSVVVFNAATGSVHTAYQLIPHDVHDWDVGATPALVKPGKADPLAVVGSKDGYVRAVDTVTGRTNWSTAVTTVTNAAAPIVPAGTHFCPGTKGGIVWNGLSASPRTAYAYVGSVDWCSTLDLATAPPLYTEGKPWLGSSDSYGTSDSKAVGHVTALDIALGTVKWTYTTPTPIVAGVTATAGGLVFTGDLAGNVYAFDERSGSVLKKLAVNAPVGGGVIAYEYGSKQYIAVAAGLRSASWGTATSTAPAELLILGL